MVAGCEGVGRNVFDVFGAPDAYGREHVLGRGAGEGNYGSRPSEMSFALHCHEFHRAGAD